MGDKKWVLFVTVAEWEGSSVSRVLGLAAGAGGWAGFRIQQLAANGRRQRRRL